MNNFFNNNQATQNFLILLMNNPDFKDFLLIQKSFLSFDETDQLRILAKFEEMDPSNYQYLSILIVDVSIARPRLVKQYIDFLCQKVKQYDLFLTTLINHLLELAKTIDREGINTINYMINQFLERSLINPQEIINKLQSNVYFSHILMDNKLLLSTTRNLPTNNFLRNIDEYSANNWEKHHLYLNKGINPDPFAEIIFNDDVETLRNLIVRLEKNPNTILQPSIYDLLSFDKPISLLEYSALCASLNCFKFLLLNGSKITKEIGFYSMSGGDIEIIRICEQNGVKRNLNDDLHLTTKYHHIELFKWVLNNEPSVNVYKNIMMFSNYDLIDYINELEYPFHYFSLCQAIEFNQFIMFKAIIERGVLDYYSENESVMNKVCGSNNNSFFIYLFENKENLQIDFLHALNDGVTPLHAACIAGNLYSFDFLIKMKGIDLNAKTRLGFVPLHYAVAYNHLDIVKKLIENNANPEFRTNNINNCFHFACSSNNIEMVKYILSICDTSKIDEMNSSKI